MAATLYVGNLTYETTDRDLGRLFTEFGAVLSARVIVDRETGKSKGFGFVELKTAAQGQAAVTHLNGRRVGGRPLVVRAAEPKPAPGARRPGPPPKGARKPGPSPAGTRKPGPPRGAGGAGRGGPSAAGTRK